MTHEWPKSWQGDTNIECGEDGIFMAVLSTDGPPAPVHAENFDLILSRWPSKWTEFRSVINKLMESYSRPRPDWSAVRCIYINIPDEPMNDESEWSIGVVFSGEDTLWFVPCKGWTCLQGKAQASW